MRSTHLWLKELPDIEGLDIGDEVACLPTDAQASVGGVHNSVGRDLTLHMYRVWAAVECPADI